MKKITNSLGLFVGAAVLLSPLFASAAYMKGDKTVFLASSDVPSGNVYVAGGNVSVASPVTGDLLAAGGTVSVTGKVSQDIMAAGGTVNLIGVSAQDARIAGGNITVGGKFSGELVAAGGQVTVMPDTTIANASYLFGGTVSFSGNANNDLTLSGGDIRIDGTVTGNLLIKKANTVTIGSHAVIKKNFEYTAMSQATIESGAAIGGQTVFHQDQAAQPSPKAGAIFAGIITAWLFIKFFIVLTAAYLIWYFFRKDAVAVMTSGRANFWRNLLRGFSFLILVPVAVIIGFISVLGAIPALVVLLFYIAILVLASPFVMLFTASTLMKGSTQLAWYHVLLGAAVLTILGLIPFIGWLACFIIYLVALGGVVSVFKVKFISDRS